MLIVALVYVWPGYRVPVFWYGIVFGAVSLGAAATWWLSRRTSDDAAHYADKYFNLRDSVRSKVNFEQAGKSGGFYDLQSKQTELLVNDSQVKSIPFEPAYRIGIVGILLIMISVGLGFKPISPTILARLEQEQSVAQLTSSANRELEQLIDDLEESLDDENERKLLEPDKLRKWVDELRETTDHKEAMRQYAKLELKFNRAAEALAQRRDEKLLTAAAEQLKKDKTSKDLAEKLKQKKYKLAADELKKMKPGEHDPGQREKLSQKRKEIAKLKAAANRMANAARGTKSKLGQSSEKQSKRNGKQNQASNSNAQPSDNGDNANAQEMEGELSEAEHELAQMLEEFEDAIEDWDDQLEEMELADLDPSDQDFEEMEEGCRECEGDAMGKLDDLADKLMRMARKRSAQAKLRKLGKKCAACQSAGTMVVRSQQKGGKKAGKGSVDSQRDTADDFGDNGQYTKLKGLKGQGPSLTKTESADDGSGVSHRRSAAKNREFKKQFESFVGREDIPEGLKNGVKNYFTNIHGTSDDATEDSNDLDSAANPRDE